MSAERKSDRAVPDIVRSLASDGTNVFIGSDSVNIAGIAQADHVARWDGTAWAQVATPSDLPPVPASRLLSMQPE